MIVPLIEHQCLIAAVAVYILDYERGEIFSRLGVFKAYVRCSEGPCQLRIYLFLLGAQLRRSHKGVYACAEGTARKCSPRCEGCDDS